MDELIRVLIGVGGAIAGALVTGIIEFIIFVKTLKENKAKYNLDIKESHLRFDKEIELMRKEQKYALTKTFNELANPDSKWDNEYLKRERVICGQILNELHYLGSITNSKRDYIGMNQFPRIVNRINVSDAELHQQFASLIGVLRADIDIYNSLRENNSDAVHLDLYIKKINKTVMQLGEVEFETYRIVLNALRENSRNQAQCVIEKLKDVDTKFKLWDET